MRALYEMEERLLSEIYFNRAAVYAIFASVGLMHRSDLMFFAGTTLAVLSAWKSISHGINAID